jgi:hypothetical protein
VKPEGFENGCSSLKGGIHAAEAGFADSLFLIWVHQKSPYWPKEKRRRKKNQNILNSKPEDFARGRAEVFPIANEAGGMGCSSLLSQKWNSCNRGRVPQQP